MAILKSVFVVGVVFAVVSGVSGITEDEINKIRAAALPILSECANEFDIPIEDVIAAGKAKDPDALDNCFYACFFKKIGKITEDGLYDVAASKEMHKKYIQGEDLAKFDGIADTCASVNTKDVTDGAKACERARLLLDCFIENKGDFSPYSS